LYYSPSPFHGAPYPFIACNEVKPSKLWLRGLEKYYLGLQVFKGIRGLGGLLFGDEVVLVNITGVKELVGRVLVLGIGQKLRPADFPTAGAQCIAQPLKFITDRGSLGSSSGGASAAAQTQDKDKDKKTKRTEKVHGLPSYALETTEKPREAQGGKTRRERITEVLWPALVSDSRGLLLANEGRTELLQPLGCGSVGAQFIEP
jgi:hypothetical protein